MEVEEDSSQSGQDQKGNQSQQDHSQREDDQDQKEDNSKVYSEIIDSIISEHTKIQSITDLYDIVLSKVDESQQNSESYEDIDLDELADECFKLLKVRLYDSFSKSMWQDQSLQQVSESQKIEFIDDKLNDSFEFFHTVSNLLIYVQQLQKQLMGTNKSSQQNKDSSMQNSSEKQNPTDSINLRQRKSNTATPTSSGSGVNNQQENKDRLRQRDNTTSNNGRAAAAGVSSRSSSKRGDAQSIKNNQQQSINSNENLGAKTAIAHPNSSSQAQAGGGSDKNCPGGEQKIFVRLNPLNVQTQQMQLYLQNFPRLEVKIGINQCLSYLLEYLHRKWLQNQSVNNGNGNTGNTNGNVSYGINIYPDSETWLIEFKGQERPKLSEQLMINDIYSGFNYPKDQVVNLLYEIYKIQPPQQLTSMVQISEWENPIQNTMPSPRLYIPLSPQNLGVNQEDNFHFLQQFSQDSDFRFFEYYEKLLNEDDDEDYVVNEDEEEEEEDDEDDEDEFEEEEELLEEDQEEEEDEEGNQTNQEEQEKKLEKQNKKKGEEESLNYIQNGGNEQKDVKKKTKNNKEDINEQKQKAQNHQSGNKKGFEKKQKQNYLQNQQNKLIQQQNNLILNSSNQFNNFNGNSDLSFEVYNHQQNLLDECKDPQNASNFDINDFNNQNQLGEYYSNQYKSQLNNRYHNQNTYDDTDNINKQIENTDIHNQLLHHQLENSIMKPNNLRTGNLISVDNLSNIIALSGLESQNFQLGKQSNQGTYEGYIDFSNTNNNLNGNTNNNANNTSNNNNNNDGYGSYSNMNLLNQESNQISRMQDNQLETDINDKDSISLIINQQHNKQKLISQKSIQNSLDQQNSMFPTGTPVSPTSQKDKKRQKIQDKQNDKMKKQKQQSRVDQSPDEMIISLMKPNPYKDIEMFQKMRSKTNQNNQVIEEDDDDEEEYQNQQKKAKSSLNNIRPPNFQLTQFSGNKQQHTDQQSIYNKEPKLQKFIKQNSGNKKKNNQGEQIQNYTSQADDLKEEQMQNELKKANISQEKTQGEQENEKILQAKDKMNEQFQNQGEEEDDGVQDEEEEGADEDDYDDINYNSTQNNNQNKKTTNNNNNNNGNNQYLFNESSQALLKDTSPLQFKHHFSNFNLFNQDSYQFNNNMSYNFNSINNIFNTSSNAHLQNPLFPQQSNFTNSNIVPPKSIIKSPLKVNPSKKKGQAKQILFGDKNSNSNIFNNDNSIMNQNSMMMRFEDPSSNYKHFEIPFSNMNFASNSRPFMNDKYTNNFTTSKFNQNSNINSIQHYRNYQHSNQLPFSHSQFNHPLHSRRDIFGDKTTSTEQEKDNQQTNNEASESDLLNLKNFQNKNTQEKSFPQINIIKSESTPQLIVKNESTIDQAQVKSEEGADEKATSTKQAEQKNENTGFRKINVVKKEDSSSSSHFLGKRFNSEQGERQQIQRVDSMQDKSTFQAVSNTEKIENLVKQWVNNQLQEINQDQVFNDSQQQDSLKYLQNESNQEIPCQNTSNNNSSNIFKGRKLSATFIQNQNSTNQITKPAGTNNNSNSNFSKNAQEVHNAIANLLNNGSNNLISGLNNNNSKTNQELSKESTFSNNQSKTDTKEGYKFLQYEFAKQYIDDQKQNSQPQNINSQNNPTIKVQPKRIVSTKDVSVILENVIAKAAAQQASQQELNLSQANSTLNSQSNIEKKQNEGSSSNLTDIKQTEIDPMKQNLEEFKNISPNNQQANEINDQNNNNDQKQNSNNKINQNSTSQGVSTMMNQLQQANLKTDLQFLENLVGLVGLKNLQSSAQNNQQITNIGKEEQFISNKLQQKSDNPSNKNILVKNISVVRKSTNTSITANNTSNQLNINQKTEDNRTSPDSSQNLISSEENSGTSKSESVSQPSQNSCNTSNNLKTE